MPKTRASLDLMLPHTGTPHAAYSNLRVSLINALVQCRVQPELMEDYGLLIATANAAFSRFHAEATKE
jgi:hypothetical protein